MDDFKVVIASDLAHDNVFAEIYYEEKFVGLVSHEPDGVVRFESPGPANAETMVAREVPLTRFRTALQLAEQRLMGK